MAEVLMDFPEVSSTVSRIDFVCGITNTKTAHNRCGRSQRSYHEAHMPDCQHIEHARGCT